MAMTIKQLRDVRKLAAEVADLTIELENAIAEENVWDHQERKFVKRFPLRPPSDARFITGNHLTGALRRRSMDLTRTLAELRRP